MKNDPIDAYSVTAITPPPTRGPGSGKAAWVAFAESRLEQCDILWTVIEDQSATIKELKAEIELLRTQIATRKPKGGKPRIDDTKVARIEQDLKEGFSKRSIAKRHRVSAMSVVRIAERLEARKACV